jgi:hypothetical protein|tara:strand:- start:578 stop:1087 length:510 start_codon:yes stop_codon:yes gene_type:complete
MKLLLENWRGYLEEMISSEDLRAFDEKYKDPKNVRELEQHLIKLGWDPKAVKHHKGESPPYAEIRNIILNLDKYMAPKSVEMIPVEKIYLDVDSASDREKKYQDYKSGKIDKYFRDTDADPDKIDFSKVPPITLVQLPNGSLEVADGMHRVFLAKKANASLPAWVVRLK